MRMVGNMSSSVDYRVITILDAPGMEKGRVTLKKSEQIYNNPHTGNEKKELRKEREYSSYKQLAEIKAL